ncbi:MAG: hypothetical protein HY677_02140 [Chloroflexi bacterium]|nr:hypothetical protein [Chloroflexota bacterium]
MANLYLVDKRAGELALDIAKNDPGAKVVLIQDGVYLNAQAASAAGVQVFAVKRDMEKRGLAEKPGVSKVIDYPELVDLIVQHKVVNFA